MRKPSYKQCVEWIAKNDDPSVLDPDDVELLTTIDMVSELWNVPKRTAALSVVRIRRKLGPLDE